MENLASLPSFQRTELDDLPVYWAEAPPPFSAALVFRVGRADEKLPTAGITHLLEHLALFAVGRRPLEIDGFVENLRTVLYAEGSRDQAFEFLAAVCKGIREPQLERLERERQVLLTEAESWSPSVIQRLICLRFGAHGHGLVGYPEYGLHRLDEEDASRWAVERFTRGNAAVWMTGPVPPDLEIDLPPGPRIPPPEVSPFPGLEPQLPAYVSDGEGGVAVSFLGKRSTTLRSALSVVANRAHQRLRLDAGLSYEILQDYDPLGADVAHLTIGADCLERHALTVRDELLQVLAELSSDGPTQQELRSHVEEATRAMEDTRTVPDELDTLAAAELFGAPVLSRAELLAEIQAVTPDAIAGALAEVSRSAIVLAPEGVPPPDSGYSAIQPRSGERLSGRTYRPSLLSNLPPFRGRSDQLTTSSEGISVATAEGEALTIRFTDCVAVLVRPDRSIELVGRDGSSIEVEIEETPRGTQILSEIRDHLPPDHFVPMEDGVRTWLAIEQVASRKLKRRWVVSDELDELAKRLLPGETLLNLAEANRGLKGGLLAVTDSRLIFLYEGLRKKEALELRHETLDSIKARLGSRTFSKAEITVMTSGQQIGFKEIVPRERTAEILAEVKARLP